MIGLRHVPVAVNVRVLRGPAMAQPRCRGGIPGPESVEAITMTGEGERRVDSNGTIDTIETGVSMMTAEKEGETDRGIRVGDAINDGEGPM